RSELFRIVDNKQRVFQRKPSIPPATAEALRVPVMQPARVTPLAAATPAPALAGKEQNILRTIERVVLEDYAPASVVINEQGEVVYFSGHTGKFLEPPPGAPSSKIINMAPRSLRLELRTAIHRALTTREEVVRPNLKIKRGSTTDLINL